MQRPGTRQLATGPPRGVPVLALLLAVAAAGCSRTAGPPEAPPVAGEWRAFEGTWSAVGERHVLHLGTGRRAAVSSLGGTVADPNAEAVPLLGVMAYVDVAWTERWTSSIGYSTTRVDNTTLQGTGAFKSGEYASVNLLAAPASNLLFGPELLWGKRTDKDGASGTDVRLQVSLKYTFSSANAWK